MGRGRQAARLPPGIGEEPQGPGRRNGRVELAQRSRGRVARIGEGRAPGFALTRVQGREIVLRHEDLAAHIEHVGDVRSGEALRDGGDGANVCRHILARIAVATGGSPDELARRVAQGAGEPVDLRLRGHGQRGLSTESEKAPHPCGEFGDFLVGEDVAERQHRDAMPHGDELLGWLRADRRCRARGRVEDRKSRFDRRETPPQGVVVGVRHRWCVVAVVGDVVSRDDARKPRMFGAGKPQGRGEGLGIGHGISQRARKGLGMILAASSHSAVNAPT